MRQYETTFVIDSQLKGGEIDEIIKKFERFISVNGGQILEVQRWGKRRLAYEIKKRQYGYYVHIRFSAGKGSIIRALEREYQLNEAILRYLTIALDKQALKAEALRKEKMGTAPTAAPIPLEAPEGELIAEEVKGEELGPVAEGEDVPEGDFPEDAS
ncbi:MAG: 30S ribosomal protein S6 [candidate division KSB1 bacterium]|nr:30S ribosomal protein S6 [candidate division KSB1 bacterium]MDZ7384981.1 30S ribosomal protein S6 [candidate division KSB1 bacterium]MDZ7391535.1 30S ribosomal protein S6 [candidate division KSB1 bacterium]MDZ7412279.1 30S ribosomal protein S6 [candidate division KSB1 bacterium]